MFGNHGLCGLPEEGAHGKSPKCLGWEFRGFWGDFAKVSGYAWDTANPFVEKSEQRLNTLAELVGNFAKVSKGEEILQTAVPLIEQIDELFFGKLDNNEEQFKHFLVRLNKE